MIGQYLAMCFIHSHALSRHATLLQSMLDRDHESCFLKVNSWIFPKYDLKHQGQDGPAVRPCLKQPNQIKAYECRLDEEVTVVSIYLYLYFKSGVSPPLI